MDWMELLYLCEHFCFVLFCCFCFFFLRESENDILLRCVDDTPLSRDWGIVVMWIVMAISPSIFCGFFFVVFCCGDIAGVADGVGRQPLSKTTEKSSR